MGKAILGLSLLWFGCLILYFTQKRISVPGFKPWWPKWSEMPGILQELFGAVTGLGFLVIGLLLILGAGMHSCT